MQAHKLEVLVIDFDQIGAEGVKDAICTARYRNHCISPSVEAIQTVEIGPWSDDHPLNNSKTCEAEYKRLFERTTSSVSQMTTNANKALLRAHRVLSDFYANAKVRGCESVYKHFQEAALECEAAAAAYNAPQPVAEQGAQRIHPPEFPKFCASSIEGTMSPEDLWDYACLTGWRTGHFAASQQAELTNATIDGGNSDCNHVYVRMDEKPSSALWTIGNRCYLATSATAIQQPQNKPNADCSGDPKSCPDNEGYGCACDPMNTGSKKP